MAPRVTQAWLINVVSLSVNTSRLSRVGRTITMTHDGQHMSDLAGVFQRLQSLLLSTTGIESFLQQLSELATGAADQPISCGITARRDGQPLTVASSDHQASMLDESQYTDGEGPCLHTLGTGETTRIEDVERETRWPSYLATAKAAGLRCSLSLPLTVDHTTVGAMNLYGFAALGIFTGEVRRRCELFAAQASGALQLTLGRVADREVLDQVDQALASRSIIDQALGIVMGQQRCTAEEAFALLRMRSQSSQTKLRDVAANLIERVTGQPAEPGKPFSRTPSP
jgi:GAF domain-containing protein